MSHSRRSFLKITGAAGAVAFASQADAGPQSSPPPRGARGMARGLTLLTLYRNGEPRLGAKTEHGILDVPEASRLLRMPAPKTMDDLLQHEDGPSLNALVSAALKSSAARPAFLDEASVKYGPAVTRPQKIVCVGLNSTIASTPRRSAPPSRSNPCSSTSTTTPSTATAAP